MIKENGVNYLGQIECPSWLGERWSRLMIGYWLVGGMCRRMQWDVRYFCLSQIESQSTQLQFDDESTGWSYQWFNRVATDKEPARCLSIQ
jgi:hypothetical protein